MPTFTSFSRPAAIAAVALGLVVAGCGSSSDKNDYVKHVNSAIASLSKSLSAAGGALSSGDAGAAAASKLDTGGDAMEKASADFAKLSPPSDAKDANAKIVDGFHKLAGNFHDMAKQARSKDLAGLTKALTAFETSDGAQEIQTAQNELAKAGYKIQGS
jgi:VIT1/CCC1 family predicted Fe2+/Mn2+ transporter